ncbi:DUF2062 domain-containing protein [Tepidimonas charontis]|uniref:DUF2062 domain-containing protein n=1 Tax=Tepidimonas charontis TaxID=2267262 RepID=A0A554XFU9_9BURK|nr:DUF2062 domain-containing protein [Tepidimonas charontis]TSE34698.1 hypothetical protein Tchar_01202 [Tepidimonas charontis]
MKARVQSLLPSRERLYRMRWLRWLAPHLNHPRLWHLNRKGLALGVALGVFFGLLIPVAQIPLSGTAAVLLRAHLPAAVASTLVTNPVTFGPVYYGAYKLGAWVINGTDDEASTPEAVILAATQGPAVTDGADDRPWWAWWRDLWTWLGSVGKPLVVGLAIVATAGGIAVYVVINAVWIGKVRLARRRRRARGLDGSRRPPVPR